MGSVMKVKVSCWNCSKCKVVSVYDGNIDYGCKFRDGSFCTDIPCINWTLSKKDLKVYFAREEVLRGRVTSSPCKRCGKDPDKNGHDYCLGTLPGVMNACCGHGEDKLAYLQYWDGSRVNGKDALAVIRELSEKNQNR